MDAALGQWLDLLFKGGATAALAIFLVGFKTGWWVPGPVVAKLEEAWAARSIRAESQVDQIIPALAKLTDAEERHAEAIRHLTELRR